MKKFNCNECGLCCKKIGDVLNSPIENIDKSLRDAVRDFPYKVDEKGVCEKLVDYKCSVYENRPLLCNINAMFKVQKLTKSLKCWHKINKEGCKILQKANGLNLD